MIKNSRFKSECPHCSNVDNMTYGETKKLVFCQRCYQEYEYKGEVGGKEMNFSIGVIDEKGSIKTIVINETFLIELNRKLKKEGITQVHTSDDNGRFKTYNIQGVIQMAKGCKGHMMYIQND